MKKIGHILYISFILVFIACSSDDKNDEKNPLPFIIEERNIQVKDSRTIDIICGNLDYTIDVKDPKIVTAILDKLYYNNSYGSLRLIPKRKGKTTVIVTDNICKTSISLEVVVLEKKEGRGILIENSNHPFFRERNMLIFFAYDTNKRFLSKEYQNSIYVTNKDGEYALNYQNGKILISLTYRNESKEKVTEIYDISQSSLDAITSLSIDLRWEYGAQTKMTLQPTTPCYLRMKGHNNEYNISAVVEYI